MRHPSNRTNITLLTHRFKYFLLLILCGGAGARAQLVTYMNKVSLVVQSEVYVDTLANETLLRVFAPRLRVALAPRNHVTDSDHYLYVSDALPRNRLNALVYRFYVNDGVKSGWQPVSNLSTLSQKFPYDNLLADTILQPGERLTVEFSTRSSGNIVQRTVFEREHAIPSIEQYREKQKGSRVEDSILSKALHRHDRIINGFSAPVDEKIMMSAGKQLEVLLTYRALNKDSSIVYRTRSLHGTSTGEWTRTGHFLTLKNLPANDSLLLDLRYEGSGDIRTYHLQVLPFWFQRGWALALFVTTGIVVFIVLPYAIRKRARQNRRERRLQYETQLKNTQSQLNPHFIFNALNSIDTLIHDGAYDKATAYLSDFSDMMRNALHNGEIMFTRLSQDIEIMEKYVRIEQLRFGFQYTIHLDDILDADSIEVPPLLWQPTVENAVKHGVSGMKENGMIQINIVKEGNDLWIRVQDNGPTNPKAHVGGNGRGLLLTKERIDKLHALYKHEIDYKLQYLPMYTLATFQFKNWL